MGTWPLPEGFRAGPSLLLAKYFSSFDLTPAMLVALTGTPGTGKSTAGELMRSGRTVIELSELVRMGKVSTVLDRQRDSLEVDTDELDEAVRKELAGRDALLVGHLSHFLSVDLIIVLRCRPSVLASRLRARGWPERKVRENIEAEGCDVILVESVDSGREVVEIDTTELTAERTTSAIEEILAGEREKYAVGHVDWSDEVMSWF